MERMVGDRLPKQIFFLQKNEGEIWKRGKDGLNLQRETGDIGRRLIIGRTRRR